MIGLALILALPMQVHVCVVISRATILGTLCKKQLQPLRIQFCPVKLKSIGTNKTLTRLRICEKGKGGARVSQHFLSFFDVCLIRGLECDGWKPFRQKKF